jgi:hypothetical protein
MSSEIKPKGLKSCCEQVMLLAHLVLSNLPETPYSIIPELQEANLVEHNYYA